MDTELLEAATEMLDAIEGEFPYTTKYPQNTKLRQAIEQTKKQLNNEFTVILLYPGCWNDAGEVETYIDYAETQKAYQAIGIVRKKASIANDGNISPEDFALIAVFPGRLKTLPIL